MMQGTPVSRRRLLDLLQRPSSKPSESKSYDPVLLFPQDEETIRVIWKDGEDETDIPAVVLVERPRQKDFFAWVTSFAPWVRPFTAYCRVVDPDTFHELLHNRFRPRSSKLISGWVGIVLGEAFVMKTFARVGGRFTTRQVMGTFSYCASRSIAIGLEKEVENLLNDWESAKDLVERRHVPYVQEIRDLWKVVSSISSSRVTGGWSTDQERIFRCCADILEQGQISPTVWRKATAGVRGLEEIPFEMRGTREDRVVLAERALQEVCNSPESRQLRAFISGYIASLIGPGTLDHIRILEPVTPIFSTAPLWYGFCAGLHSQEGVEGYSNGIGRRIAREIQRPANLTERPSCDVALGELTSLMSGPPVVPDFLRNSGTSIEVELAPGVSGWFRWSTGTQEQFESPIPVSQIGELFDHIDDLSYRFDVIQRDVSKIANLLHLPAKEQKRKGGRK